MPTVRERIAASPRELEDVVRVVVTRIAGEEHLSNVLVRSVRIKDALVTSGSAREVSKYGLASAFSDSNP